MKLTDFLDKEYGPGDLVLYAAMSGRCPNMIIGRVTDIYRVYRDPDEFGWVRLDEDAPVPTKTNWKKETSECDTSLRVKIQPLRGARWEQHHDKTYYTDTRSGKRINPDAPSGKHILKDSHYVRAGGTEFDWEAEKAAYDRGQQPGWGYRTHYSFDHEFRKRFHVNHQPLGVVSQHVTGDERCKTQLWYVSRTYQPWVEEHTEGPKPVTIEITGNIVKWEGELPDADVPVPVPGVQG